MQSNDRHRVYKRLETDDELRTRCCHAWCYSKNMKDTALDAHIEGAHDKQRRIVEDTTDKTKPSQESLPAARDARSAKR